MSDINVTVATDQEARACLALLPEVAGRPVELLIARRGTDFVGAAALFWQSSTTPAGFPVTIHVVPGHRRVGVGSRLLQAAADLSAEETDGLWSLSPVADASEAALFMQACGFDPFRRKHHFEATVEALLADVSPKADRLRARGRIPDEARVVPLGQAPLEEVGRMVLAGIGQGPDSTGPGLARRLGRDEDQTQILMHGARAIGAMLWRLQEPEVAVVDARVVHPRFRGGWPNLLLLEAGLRRCQDVGVIRFRFDCDDTVRDTLSLARRCAAVETETKTTWYYAIAAEAD